MTTLDWVVLGGTIGLIVAYGAWKTREVKTRRRLPARRRRPALVDHRPLDHGDAGERHHLSVDAGPGLPGRHGLHPVLLRPAGRDGHPVGADRADLLPAQGLYRVRISGDALRSQDAPAGGAPLPRLARPRRRASRSTRRRSCCRRCSAGRSAGPTLAIGAGGHRSTPSRAARAWSAARRPGRWWSCSAAWPRRSPSSCIGCRRRCRSTTRSASAARSAR